ncbi:MAG: 4-hydroxybenzoate octaprenyltransferase [Rhodospirillales bacterium]|nr:4-hydroxybenzoate octaprenyltransferase [Rhodospirillales bacterium]
MTTGTNTASDIRVGHWVERLVPDLARPYLRMARIDRPIGTWLLLFPCWWSVALASSGWPSLYFMILFAVGALVMRGAGCTLNDIVDRDFDARVARTALRPIPSGAVSVPQAVAFIGFLLLIGFTVLVQFNGFAVLVGVASLALVAVYPFMKRITYWPQAVLGLTFTYGALLGWAAVRGSLDGPAVVLYAGCFFWTLGYDTIYAHQDKEDDALVGIKSTALLFGDTTKRWLSFFFSATIVLFALAGAMTGLAWPFYAALALAAGQFIWQVWTLDINDPKDCLAKFKSNRLFSWIVLAGIIAGQVAA